MAHFWWASYYYATKFFYRTIMIFFSTQISMHHYIYVQKHMSMYIFLFMHKNWGGDYFIRGWIFHNEIFTPWWKFHGGEYLLLHRALSGVCVGVNVEGEHRHISNALRRVLYSFLPIVWQNGLFPAILLCANCSFDWLQTWWVYSLCCPGLFAFSYFLMNFNSDWTSSLIRPPRPRGIMYSLIFFCIKVFKSVGLYVMEKL